MSKLFTLCAAFAALTCSAVVQASLLGHRFECSATGYFDPSECVTHTTTVGDGVEFELPIAQPLDATFNVDIGANSVVLTYFEGAHDINGGMGRIVLTDLDLLGVQQIFKGISNFKTNANGGISASDISFTDDSLIIDIQNSSWFLGQSLSFDISSTSTAIPEPTSLALVGIGMAAALWTRRKREDIRRT